LAVERVVHLLDQCAVDVAGEELVPLAGPDHLDHVPARAAEDGLELLDDLAVAADGAVESLEIAVHDERQVVETLAGGDMERIETVGNSQKSGISRGCGYDGSPSPGAVSRRKWSSWSSVSRPSRKARA